MPLDTSPEIERVRIKIYQRMSQEERLHLGIQLTRCCRTLLAEGVKLRHPEYNEKEIQLAVARLQLGESLFRTVYPQFQHLLP